MPTLLLLCSMKVYQPWRIILFLAYSILSNNISTFSHLHFLFKMGTFLVMVLIVYHSSYLIILAYVFAGAICSVSSCLRISRSLSILVLHALISGTITFNRMHISNWVVSFGSVSIASILPTCDLPFSIAFCLGVYQRQSFKTSMPTYVYWSTIGNSSFPTLAFGMCRIHLILVTYSYCSSFHVRCNSPSPRGFECLLTLFLRSFRCLIPDT